MNGWMDHMWDFWGMGWGMWFWLLLFIGLGYLFYINYRPRTYYREREDPLEIAKLRLARGEISPEEFEEIKKTLEGSR
jgi:putative membrane protein